MSGELSWFKSSYSDSEGSACLEVAYNWRKSSYSSSGGGECLEVAACPHTIHIRDSKLGTRSPRFTIPSAAWTAFVTYASREA
ncbi:DUF397 domain-containing protein [Streptomyces vastus]|uniref:DUF397 domain-containing protein n=1 Tax=Streptomyces vastus TaxID=285451 RepID=A0ABN3Q8M8_9ACTN